MQYATSCRTLLLALGLPAPVLLARSSTGAASTGPTSTGTASTCAAITNTLVLETPKETLSTRNYTIHDKDDRDVRNEHFVILLHNFKGIYAVLTRI